MRVAATSLPVPLSPVISTVLSLLPITRRNSKTARIRALRPTTTESIETSGWGIMAVPSEKTQCLEFGNFLPKCDFDADVQRHQRARAPCTHAREPHLR